MGKRKMSGAERFFYDNAGYVVGKRRECAEALAHAEAVAAAEGWEVQWEFDPEPYSTVQGENEPDPKEVLCAVLLDAAGNVLASLGGIADPSRAYGRVVEAELASEALARAAELTTRARKAVR